MGAVTETEKYPKQDFPPKYYRKNMFVLYYKTQWNKSLTYPTQVGLDLSTTNRFQDIKYYDID